MVESPPLFPPSVEDCVDEFVLTIFAWTDYQGQFDPPTEAIARAYWNYIRKHGIPNEQVPMQELMREVKRRKWRATLADADDKWCLQSNFYAMRAYETIDRALEAHFTREGDILF